MHQRVRTGIVSLALALATVVAPSAAAQASPATAQRGVGYTAADVQFMQGMIAERMSGAERRSALSALAAQLDGDAAGAPDSARVRAMAAAVRELANASM